ncbi:Fe-S cluster assembly protein SufD [Nocardioides sp. zg-1228]|uniref:Fe-S cluster assembly protein SufD n=1 Tax=Nocardioides sp. zg-1228 TaxID=2763008 RepID=UPI0016429316|nr:Fe-S cluster assembly protein SufD [Nocardioides sp. zg-1228]MBC2934997.1 Fe-S cluster assembly protein SufD [Nocardioides sp. zg-1228]QSF56172.1 Fe-S cluster assembly protein SufD [Nocardioides sp. zg-1228]
MTVTTDSVRSALEQAPADRVESHLHPAGSFAVADHVVPTGREEIWRFTPLKRLKGLHADAPLDGRNVDATWTAPEGVSVGVVTGDEATALRGVSGWVPNTRFTARVLADVPATLLVDVPADVEATEPIVLEVDGTDADVTSGAHVVLRFGRHSKGVVVLNHTGSAAVAAVVEVVVADGAEASVVSIQDWADDAVHLSHHQALVGRDATYKHAAISFGGDLVRMDANVTYDGPGGSAELLGLYFADAGQHIEHRIFADHTAPRTKSHAVYKGALQGEKAHTVWVGNVLIRKIAEGIETYEENRNLVLTDGCRADSIPNLEIETGEIEGAGHASATARFDDEQLFYLQSRGISEAEAQRLVVHGFFNDLIRQVGVPSIEERLLSTVEAELAKNVLKDVGSLAAFASGA